MNDDDGDAYTAIGGEGPIVLWFRTDLRIADNPALFAAVATGRPIVPVFILEEATPDLRAPGAAKLWWLHHSLSHLRDDLQERGPRLTLRRGDALSHLRAIIEATGADAIVWNRRYGRGETDTDAQVETVLHGEGVDVTAFAGHLLHDPSRFTSKTGTPYKVYTPFWNAFVERVEVSEPSAAPERIATLADPPQSEDIADWPLLPTAPDWATGMDAYWKPGERGGRERLDAFASSALDGYAVGRDLPAEDRTSRLSPYLALGEVSPAQAWAEADGPGEDALVFRKELAWREFSYHLLVRHPDMPRENIAGQFDRFPWRELDDAAKADLRAWQRGRTGYPIIDAGMRQLWHIGWMHNRVRMITASFLIKHLLLDWRHGEAWFWDTLVDADAANNANGWQWVAGSGADASPFFRVFIPILQGEKFDPDGDYVREWVPELAELPARYIHAPWKAPDKVLAKARVRLGASYPEPIVDHAAARERALAAYAEMRAGAN